MAGGEARSRLKLPAVRTSIVCAQRVQLRLDALGDEHAHLRAKQLAQACANVAQPAKAQPR
jgi:hypothetical protein